MNNFKHIERQDGAVLVISLLILLIITAVGVTSMQSATMEERMSGNMQDKNAAFQSGEAGLRQVESGLLEAAPNFLGKVKLESTSQFTGGTQGLYSDVGSPADRAPSLNELKDELKSDLPNSLSIASTTVVATQEDGSDTNGANVVITRLEPFIASEGGGGGEILGAGNPGLTRLMTILKVTSVSQGVRKNTSTVVESTVGIEPLKDL